MRLTHTGPTHALCLLVWVYGCGSSHETGDDARTVDSDLETGPDGRDDTVTSCIREPERHRPTSGICSADRRAGTTSFPVQPDHYRAERHAAGR